MGRTRRKLSTLTFDAAAGSPPPSFDDAAMVLRSARVSSPALDRDSEICDPAGCRLDHFKLNPVALWGHKQDELPVGRWADEGGSCTVATRPDGVYGDLYFSKANPKGSVLYGMYREKVLRAFSVGFVPVEGGYLSQSDAKAVGAGGRAYLHRVWDLLEISCVPVGCNPEALAKMLHKGVVGGERIPAGLSKALTPYAARRMYVAVRQATAATKLLTVLQRAAAVSTTADKPADAAKPVDATTKAAPAAKDMSTLDDTGGGAVVAADDREPHEQVQDGLYAAIQKILEKWRAGEITWDDCKTQMDGLAGDHEKYGAGDSDADADTTVKKDEDEDDLEDGVKRFTDMETKVATLERRTEALEAENARLRAKVDPLPTADELLEAIAAP
jgi:hypothetical protein